MSKNHDSHDIERQLKTYKLVAGSLAVFTLVTVGISYLHITSDGLAIAIALFISSVEGFLVAGYMMHLLSEQKMIYGIMLTTVFFFIVLMFLIAWSTEPSNRLGYHVGG